jgi:hypothetical protein
MTPVYINVCLISLKILQILRVYFIGSHNAEQGKKSLKETHK